MSFLDNIKSRSNDEGDAGGKFNPFRLLDIGEIMVRYTDGIRIKDFVFLAILTSERLILIDSARQGTGQITKEIPFSVIKQADLERDERDRPALAISMEVGGQQRVMRLVFTGLISEPESECREWFTAINGYPPERREPPAVRLDEPADILHVETKPVFSDVVEPSLVQSTPSPPAPVSPALSPVSTPSAIPEPVQAVDKPVVTPAPMAVPPPPVSPPTPVSPPPAAGIHPPVQSSVPRVTVRSVQEHQNKSLPVKSEIPSHPITGDSIRVVIDKPKVSAFKVQPNPPGDGGMQGVKSFKYCMSCGARNPSHARFCQICGSTQT